MKLPRDISSERATTILEHYGLGVVAVTDICGGLIEYRIEQDGEVVWRDSVVWRASGSCGIYNARGARTVAREQDRQATRMVAARKELLQR